MRRWIAFALAAAMVIIFTGCGKEEADWEKGAAAEASPQTTAAPAVDIEQQLQGQWLYYDSTSGSYDVMEFRNGTVICTSWLESVPEKMTVSEATYTVDGCGIDMYFPKTDYHNRFDYSWVGSELVLSRYIDSGYDAGNTRIFQKQDNAVPGTAPAEAPVVAAREPVVGEWTAVGIVSKGSVVSFADNDALADLYDSNWAAFLEDGSFQIQNGVFTNEGGWQALEAEDVDHLYMLSQTGYSRFTMKDGELEEVVTESEKTLFAAFLDDACDVLLIYETLDEEETPLIYTRDGKESGFSDMTNGGSSSQQQSKPSSPSSKPSQSSGHTPTSGEKNALQSAKDYLKFMAFSYEGLIDQLEYEGYSYSEAKYAVDNCGADWYEQAVKCAESYLEYMSFSRSDLIDQLEYEGFTHDQAVYGVDKAY